MSVKTCRESAPAAAVRRRLRAMARAQARLDELEAELARERQRLHARYEHRINARRDRLARMEQKLESYCRQHREAIFAGGRKSLKTPLGRVGFRRSGPSVRVRPGVDRITACRRLARAGLDRFLRVRRSPDRRALNRALREGELRIDRLEDCGLEVLNSTESFHCTVYGAGDDGGGRS